MEPVAGLSVVEVQLSAIPDNLRNFAVPVLFGPCSPAQGIASEMPGLIGFLAPADPRNRSKARISRHYGANATRNSAALAHLTGHER
jgi:hypothetical protein